MEPSETLAAPLKSLQTLCVVISGYLASNSGWTVQPFDVWTSFSHLNPVFNYNLSQLKAASNIISARAVDDVGLDTAAKFGDSRSNSSREIVSLTSFQWTMMDHTACHIRQKCRPAACRSKNSGKIVIIFLIFNIKKLECSEKLIAYYLMQYSEAILILI